MVKSELAVSFKTPFLRKLCFIVSIPGSSHYTPAKPSRALSFISQFYGMTGVWKIRSQLNKLKHLMESSVCILRKKKGNALGYLFLIGRIILASKRQQHQGGHWRERENLAKFYEGNENVIPVKSPLISPSFLINISFHLIFRKSENTSGGCELLFPSNFILLQLSREQIFWEVSKTSTSKEPFLESKYNSSVNLADTCGYFSDKELWDLLIHFSKKKKKIPPVLLYLSPQNILVCGLWENGSFKIIAVNCY